QAHRSCRNPWPPGVVLVACAMNTCDHGDVDGARGMPTRHAAATFAMGACTSNHGRVIQFNSIDATSACRDAHARAAACTGWARSVPLLRPPPSYRGQVGVQLAAPPGDAQACRWRFAVPCATRAFSPVVEGGTRKTRPAREGGPAHEILKDESVIRV